MFPLLQMGHLFSILWPLFNVGPASLTADPSLHAVSYLAPVLEQVMTGQADEETWVKYVQVVLGLIYFF